MSPQELSQLITTAGQFHEVGKFAEAEGLYRRALAHDPHRAEAMCGLGLLLSQQGRHEEAIRFLPWQTVWSSSSPLLLTALGASMLALGGADGAVESAARAVELNAGFAPAHNLLGCALLSRGEIERSIHAFVAAIKVQPAYVDAFFNLGTALSHAGLFAEAEKAFVSTLRLNPRHAKALLNRGFVLRELGQLDAALASFHQAIDVKPEFPEALHNVGTTLAEKGRVHEGIEFIRRALAANPRNFHAHSAIVYLMNFDPASSSTELAAEAGRWAAQHVTPGPTLPLRNDRSPDRRLKIGYVSPDFRGHAESWFMLPLLAAHDRQEFEVHCYSSVRRPDAVTDKMRVLADKWHNVGALPDAQLAAKIQADGIDILIDLTMHMDHHRTHVFAHRPSPVQIAWLAYPGGTGLPHMTHRITDSHLVPVDAANGYTETALRLPNSWFCFQPSAEAPPLGPPPMSAAGTVTFGSLNTYRKMSPTVLELWADTLAAVEAGGRKTALIMACPEGDHRAAALEVFASRGIAAEKIRLLSRLNYQEYLATYQEIDIALDPFPHNGATTTCEALWMGVPVLTIAGETEPGRLGVSILNTCGLQDWIATTREEFVRKAVAFSGNAAKLTELRATMRDRMRASPLLDAPGFARHFEAACRTAWHEWCRS